MILIKSGRVVDPERGTETVLDLIIKNGVIERIGKLEPDTGFEKVIHAENMVVAPGLVDVHAHFRQPGFTYKEDISSGARAAAKGGFTTVVCMANTKPAVDNEQTLLEVLALAEKENINVLTVAAVSKGLKGRGLTDMARLRSLGAVGFSDDGIAITDPELLRAAMLAARELGVPISLHEEDPVLIGCAGINEGEVSGTLGIRGAPGVSETGMVERDVLIALETKSAAHIQHLSCEGSVEAVRRAKSLGARVTAEVTPQHFSLTQDAVLEKGALAKLNPPLRTERDRQSLIMGLKDGTIDIIATDHAPHSAEEKRKPLTEAPSGMIGLETALPLGITNLVRTGCLTLPELIFKMSRAPAKLYGLDAGVIAVGKKAELVIFDENESFVVESFLSKSSNSPFVGERLYGKVKYTICGGNIIYEDD